MLHLDKLLNSKREDNFYSPPKNPSKLPKYTRRKCELTIQSIRARKWSGAAASMLFHALSVFGCPEFLASSFFPFPACLQFLFLKNVKKHMETLKALSNLTSLTELYLDILGDSRDKGLWPLLAHGRLTKIELHAGSDFFACPDPSRPHDREVFSRSCKLFDLNVYTNTGVLAVPICSLLSSTLTKLTLTLDMYMERLTTEQEEELQLPPPSRDSGFCVGSASLWGYTILTTS